MVGRSIVGKLAVTATVAVVGFAGAASAAQASPTWTTTGDFDAQGHLTLQVAATGAQYGCSISYTGTADNTGGVARATVRDVSFSDCYTNRPGCSVSAMTANAPSSWGLEASGASAPFRIQHTMSVDIWTTGTTCPDGFYFTTSGAFGSDFRSPSDGIESYVEFIDEPSLSSPVGPAFVSGAIGFVPTDGGDLDLT